MAKNKIITSQGNVQFINSKGKTISIHPMHCYAVYQDDTVSFLFIYMKEYSGQAFFSSQFEDLEVDGETYDSIDALKEAIAEAFAKAGAQARTEIVDELPETGYTNTIYLVKKEHGEGYDEYVYNDEKGWQLLGDTDIEFERYLQKVDFNAYSADTKEKIDFISGAVDTNASDIQFISGAVDTEIANREAADTVISGAVDTLSTNLSNEVQRAQNAEQTLQNNINTVNSRVDAEQIARANADNAISGAVDSVVSDLASEVSRATAKENEIDSKVDGEISAREAADSVISGAVDTLSANLSLEAQRAQNAESALDSKINALSGAVDGKQDTLIAGENITISGNVISSTGGGDIDSGAVETMIEDYMTDTNYVSYSALTNNLETSYSGNTRWNPENTYFRILNTSSIGGQGYVIPSGMYYSGEKKLWLSSPQISDDFIEYTKYNGIAGSQAASEVLLFALKAEYASTIPSIYKSKEIWYGFNEIPRSPKFMDEISGFVGGSSYVGAPTTYENVSGCTYLVFNMNQDYDGTAAREPLNFSGLEIDDMNPVMISCNGFEVSFGKTIGFYLAMTQLRYDGIGEKCVVSPLSNEAFKNPASDESGNIKAIYNLTMDKTYEGDDFTSLYAKVSSAQTTANSGLTTANQALNIANNANRVAYIQADWNQNNSGSSNVDYIKNRPMWSEKVYTDKIYESDAIMSFELNDYEVALDSPLTLGDGIKVVYKSRYDTSTGQTMFTDTIKVNSGTVPSGSYYAGTYDPMGWNSSYMWSNDLQTWYVTSRRFDYESNLYIIKASDLYHKLDSNYIGDDIQRTLVSGTNIKTINNESILGSGNIDIQGGGGKAIEAGRGISITTGATADTVSFDLPISAGTKANNIIIIAGEANNNGSLVHGIGSRSNGIYSNVFGYNCFSNSNYSFLAGGYLNNYNTEYGVVFGKYNSTTNSPLFSVGNGTANDARHNAFEIRQNGDIYCSDGTNDVKLQDTITATAANTTALGGLSLVKLTSAEYESLTNKDSNTLYIISD